MDVTNATWRKSTRSGNNGGACVELAVEQPGAIRDSKNPLGAVLEFTQADLATLFGKIKAGRLDR